MDLSKKASIKRARIEMIPLIDCMFLMLVFFVYGMLALTQPQGIPVNLPRSVTAPLIREESLSVTITDTGEFYLDKEKVSLGILTSRIAAARSANPSLRVLINGDKNARHGAVVKVLDILRTLSVEHVAIQTAPAETAAAEPEEK
jgi:biopolymer transport protein ExbD